MKINNITFACTFLILALVVHQIYAQPLDKINIFASIPPQKYLIERVGGENVNVNVMIDSGQNPTTYEPTPKQMTKLAEADIYFRIGVPFENIWIEVISKVNDSLKIVECCESLADRRFIDQAHNHGGTYKRHDPHVWTSPVKAMDIAKQIYIELLTVDPQSEDYYSANYKKLIDDLVALDRKIQNMVNGVDSLYLIVSHPSWGYYADAYGLKQVAIEQKGKDIQAKALVRIIEFAREEKIRTVFVQKQFNHDSAKILADEIDATVQEIDPLAENYIENLYFVTSVIVNGLKKK